MTRLSVKPMPTAPNTIGSRLKQEMRKQGLTSTELARRSEVKTSFIYDVISGKSANPSTIKLARVADSLGVNLAYLAGFESSPGGQTPIKAQNENHEHVTLASLSADGHSNDPVFRKDAAPYQFSKSWISQDLQSSPENLRITTMRGDSMQPTLYCWWIPLKPYRHLRAFSCSMTDSAWLQSDWNPQASNSPQRFA